ncbi:MAG TPA: hypothetical protein VFS00_10015, partial [Polyangiaceae bacterium]|nr:hypothetical protein [Polyangiaceae bacterium]
MNNAKVGKTKVEAGKAAGKAAGRGVIAKRRGEGVGRKKKALRATAGTNVPGGGIEVDEARQAYEASQLELATVCATEILARRVDMQRAAAVAH